MTSILRPAAPPAPATLHSLPCHIDHSGPCQLSTYFRVTEAADPAPYRAHIRGHELQGQRVEVPYPQQLLVLREQAPAANGGGPPTWQIQGTADGLTDWEWNRPPSQHSPLADCLQQWPAVAGALHTPVTAAEVEAEMKESAPQGEGNADTATRTTEE